VLQPESAGCAVYDWLGTPLVHVGVPQSFTAAGRLLSLIVVPQHPSVQVFAMHAGAWVVQSVGWLHAWVAQLPPAPEDELVPVEELELAPPVLPVEELELLCPPVLPVLLLVEPAPPVPDELFSWKSPSTRLQAEARTMEATKAAPASV
jgi:hypothetical protein